jgi:dTDP-4-amino-4,6-dideoxygalactose transaminase
MTRPSIPYIKPLIPPPEAWIGHLKESYASGYYANFGPAVRNFEHQLKSKYARDRAVISCPSATHGLVCALQALGIRGKVLMPSYTFVATAQAVLMAGCEPVFGDISPQTWELDPAVAESLVEREDIQAIIHVRAFGFGHDLAAMQELAASHRLPLIVDAAAALGTHASATGHVGQQGDVEIFSLHATKVFAIGEGGVAFAKPELEEPLRRASNFGIQYPDDVTGPGLNSKLSDFQAAVGLGVLERIDGYIDHRQSVAEHYHRTLSKVRWVEFTPPPELSPWQSYPMLLDAGKDISRIISRALEDGLELKRGYYQPLHRTTFLARYAKAPLPNTDQLCTHVVCLPVHSDMAAATRDRVLEIFTAVSA